MNLVRKMELEQSINSGDMPSEEKTENNNFFINFEDPNTSPVGLRGADSIENFDSYVDFTAHRTEGRSTSFLTDWAFMSHGIFQSNEINNQNTVFSLKHVPSNDRKSNAFLMGVNLQSMILGTSVLGFPFCVKIAGVWALLAIVLVGLASSATSAIIGDCQYQKSLSKPGELKRVHISFVQMSKICMGKFGAFIMKVLVYMSLLRNVIVVILLTDLTKNILTEVGITGYDKRYLTIAWTLATIPLLFITKVSYLAWVSFIGLKLYLCALLSMLVIFCLNYDIWNFADISWTFDLEGFGIALGIIINSYSVHMNLPSLEGSLKNPSHYKAASHVTFLFNNIVKVAFALFGYLTYTDTTKQEIISNVTSFKPLPVVLQIAIIFFTYFTVPMQSFVAFELIDSSFRRHFPLLGRKSWLVLTRLVFMTLALLIAILIPHFGLVVSLIGSVRGSMITLILPAAYYVMLRTHEIRTHKVVVSFGIMVFGAVAGLLGLYSSIKALIVGVNF
ncbi:vesicular inhibitory amino acid transporter-like [Clytia hemisphaerica]